MSDYENDLQRIKEEVRARSDIVELIGQYTKLKRAGKSWTGLCPFHADRRPSFSVHPPTQSYRCWSCGEKGDIFNFFEKKENFTFMEALEFLAKRVGIPFEARRLSPEQKSEREEMLALNQLAADYFRDQLRHSKDAQQYLANRAILKPTQDEWEIGFAPDRWDGLLYHLERNHADLRLATRIGLLKARQSDGNGYYDTFRNRIQFPIHDLQGQIIGFGGRTLGDDPAKYLNSEQSPLFDKSRILYGLCFARKHLSETRPPVFVEGYMDVITTHQAGFRQCIATLGTSLTEEHARILVRYAVRALICYDADTAGIKATQRAAGVWDELGVEGGEIRVVRLPGGDDPDSLLRRGEADVFQRALDSAIPRLDFEMEMVLTRHDLATDEGRDSALAELVPILATIRTQSQRDRYVQRIAHLHPAHRFSLTRAIASLLTDIQSYALRHREALSSRTQGYPLTQQTNRLPLAENPNQPSRANGGKNRRNSPYPDHQPRSKGRTSEPLILSSLTGVEKAERQLLRALFDAQWRTFVLGRIHPDYMVSELAKAVFQRVAQTPANAEGAIDTLEFLAELENEDTEQNPQEDPFAGDALHTNTNSMYSNEEENGNQTENVFLNEADLFHADTAQTGDLNSKTTSANETAKLSNYLRELLEDSSSLMSNEPHTEASLNDCMRRLKRHWEEQMQRRLLELANNEDLSPEQRRGYLEQYQAQIRQFRGSQSSAADH